MFPPTPKKSRLRPCPRAPPPDPLRSRPSQSDRDDMGNKLNYTVNYCFIPDFFSRQNNTANKRKITFPLRFWYVNYKIFSKISRINWFFAQTRKNLSLGFVISFRFITDFQNSIKIALIFY